MSNKLPVIERSKRCQSCIHWDHEAPALKRYKELKFRDLSKHAASIMAGETAPPAVMGHRLGDDEHVQKPSKSVDMNDMFRSLGLNYDLGDNLIRTGQIGICLKGAVEGDFVHYAALCDQWTGRVKPADGPDELSEAAKARLGYDK